MASERCWEVHKKCCITGTKGIAGSKPKDNVSMHIWQHAYQDEVCSLFSHLWVVLIFLQWLASGFEQLCTDHGPDGQNRHEYTGWHHICCLNNMASVRSDLHELFDAFELGIDFHVGIFLLRMKYFFTRHPRTAVVLSAFPRNEHIYPSIITMLIVLTPMSSLWKLSGMNNFHNVCTTTASIPTYGILPKWLLQMIGHRYMTPAPVMMNDGRNGIWHIWLLATISKTWRMDLEEMQWRSILELAFSKPITIYILRLQVSTMASISNSGASLFFDTHWRILAFFYGSSVFLVWIVGYWQLGFVRPVSRNLVF